MEILFVLFLAIVLAYIFSELCDHVLHIPRVVGQIGAGIVMGFPGIRELLFGAEEITILSALADVGIVLMFFFVGLQISLSEFERRAKEHIIISAAKTLPMLLIGFLFASEIMGLGIATSIILAVCITVSAQAIAVDMLEEYRLLKSKLGKMVVMVGAVDDIFEFLLIGVILLIIKSASAHVGLLLMLRDLVLFIIVLILFRTLFIPFVLKTIEREYSQTTLFTGSLIIVLLMAGLAELLHLGSLVGALLAGMLVRKTLLVDEKGKYWEEHRLAEMIHLIGFGFLIPIFFIFAGLSVDLTSIPQNWALFVVITILAFIGVIGGTTLGAKIAGYPWRESWVAGWALNSKGDVEVVLANIALQAGLFTAPIYSAVVLMALATTVISPVVFRRLLTKLH